jgi:hypothetical protein
MNQKTTRALAWYATNGAEFYLMYLWLFNDVQWARIWGSPACCAW